MTASDLVAVLRTADQAVVPFVKSVLDGAGIAYVIQGEQAMGMLPLGALGRSLTGTLAAVTVLVAREHEQEAREALSIFEDPAP